MRTLNYQKLMMKNNFKYGSWFHKFVQEFVSLKGEITEEHLRQAINNAPDKIRARHEANNFLVSPLAEFINNLKLKAFTEVVLHETQRADIILAIPSKKMFLIVEIKTSVRTLASIHREFQTIIRQTVGYSNTIKNITGFRALETIYLSRYGVWFLNDKRKRLNKLKIIHNSDDLCLGDL